MRYLLLAILLAFPAADLYSTVRFAQWTGIPAWLWLTCSTLIGFTLLRNERRAFRTATVNAMHGEQPLLRGLVDSGRKVLAALLLLVPGIISDLMALVLLAFPINLGERAAARSVGPRQYEGEFRRID